LAPALLVVSVSAGALLTRRRSVWSTEFYRTWRQTVHAIHGVQ